MSRLKNVNWFQLAIDLAKVLIGAFGGALATAHEPFNEVAYALQTAFLG